jgi:excinuclease ABC subunit A
MDFLPDVTIGCEVCKGQRFQDRVLECRLEGLTIAEFLETPIGQVTRNFQKDKSLTAPLLGLVHLGLSYLRLGQEATELSAGELQRLRLALLLNATDERRLAVLLDEPTRGLGFEEVGNLVKALHGLVEAGHIVIVVEHNLDVISAADWIIDMGPEGGDGGGQLIVEGPPRLVQSCANSHTGKALLGLSHAENENRPMASLQG